MAKTTKKQEPKGPEEQPEETRPPEDVTRSDEALDIGAEVQTELDAQVERAPGFGTAPEKPPEPPKPVKASLWDKPGVAQYVEDYWADPNEQALRQAVADWIGEGKGKLLDVGCGSARVALMIKGWEYTGLDSSIELLRVAATRVKPSRLVTHDLGEPLPFRDDEFDVVMIMNVLRHLDSYGALVAEMTRVARRYVYIVDMFTEADSHKYEKALVAGQEFGNNTWALPLFLADAGRLTGWQTERHALQGLAWPVTGVRMEVP